MTSKNTLGRPSARHNSVHQSHYLVNRIWAGSITGRLGYVPTALPGIQRKRRPDARARHCDWCIYTWAKRWAIDSQQSRSTGRAMNYRNLYDPSG